MVVLIWHELNFAVMIGSFTSDQEIAPAFSVTCTCMYIGDILQLPFDLWSFDVVCN